MESDLQQRHHYQLHRHQKQMNSGLTRYQSAPSSYFSSFQDKDSLEEFLNRPTSPETERIFSGFLQSSGSNSNVDSFLDQSFLEKKPEIKTEQEETETTMMNQKQNLQSENQNHNQIQLPGNNYPLNRNPGSNLLRQSSSPAGFFSSVDIENAYATVMRNMGGVTGGGNNSVIKNNKETSFSTPSSKPPPIPVAADNKPAYSAGLPPRTLSGGLDLSGWEDSSLMSETSSVQKTLKKRGRTLSVGLEVTESKNMDAAKRPPLAHHRSLPKSLSDIEKLMESSDSVAWKIRAKRGCATHPRSIAERVRRTRISQRIKKLQDLVPNMDKQTNTAEMLDLAVEYIKDLQTQIKILSENRANCTCSRMQMQMQ